MASGEYVVGRDIDFQYADNAAAGDADISTGSRKKSKKKTKKKKHAGVDPAPESQQPRNNSGGVRIVPPQPQGADYPRPPDTLPPVTLASLPPQSPQAKPSTPREARRPASAKPPKRAQSQNGSGEDTDAVSADQSSPPMAPSPSAAAPSRHRNLATSQQGRRHMAYSPDKELDTWFTSSNEERERVREFWRQLPTKEREELGRLDKEQLFQRVRRQRRDCACSVCGGQREAVEEELEELYTMSYDKLKQYSARLLEGDTLFSKERFSSENPALTPRRRIRSRSSAHPSNMAASAVSPSSSALKASAAQPARRASSSAGAISAAPESPQRPEPAPHSTLPSTQMLNDFLPPPETPEQEAQLKMLQRSYEEGLQYRELDSQQYQEAPLQSQELQAPEQQQQQQEQHRQQQQEQQEEGLPLKTRNPLEMLYTQLVPSSNGGPPGPLLAEIAKAYKNMPLPDDMNPSEDRDLANIMSSPGQAAETWKRVTKTFQELVLDHLMKASPGGDPKVLADSQVLETLDKVVRAGRVDPGSLAGGIMGLADDLLRNDGKQFMNMYEQQQTKPGAEQVLQPLKQLYDNYRLAEGPIDSPDLIAPSPNDQQFDGESQASLRSLKNSPGFNLTVRVDADVHEHEEEEDEFEDAVEEEVEYEDDDDVQGFVCNLDDDYTDGYSEAEDGSAAGEHFNDLAEYGRGESWEDEVANVEMSEKKRLMEGFLMLRTFTARVFEQRVLQAYREHVARERQQLLLEELAEEESRAAKERELRKTKDKEKKKNKKALARQQREEEQRLKQAEQEKAREEQRLKEEQRRLHQLELDRIKQEAHRRKIEERMAKMELEAKQREAQERQRDAERLRLEKEQAEEAEKVQRERLEQIEKEKKEREAAVRSLLEREKVEKDKEERKRKQREKDRQDRQLRERERLEKERQPTPKQVTPRQAPPGLANADGTPKFAVPQMSSMAYPLQGLQNGMLASNSGLQGSQPSPATLRNSGTPINPPGLQANTPDLQRMSMAGFQTNPTGLQSTPTLASIPGLQPGLASSMPTQAMQSLALQQSSQQPLQSQSLQSGFPSLMSQPAQPSSSLSSLWSTVPQQQPPQQQQAQKWNTWSPWSTTPSEDRATPDIGQTPSPPQHASSPWSNGASMWATRSSNLDEIRSAAQSCYESIVKDGLGVDGYVPSQVLYHATLDAAGGRFSQNDLYKALAQLLSFECIRDDVGLITHVKIQST